MLRQQLRSGSDSVCLIFIQVYKMTFDFQDLFCAVADKILLSLEDLSLDKLTNRSPYQLMVACHGPESVVDYCLEAYLSSSIESQMGNLLDSIIKRVSGCASTIRGVDLDVKFPGGVRGLISLKTGETWGNSTSHKGQGDLFKEAKEAIGGDMDIVSIMGIISSNKKSKKFTYADYKICGQTLLFLLTGDSEYYVTLGLIVRNFFTGFHTQIEQAKNNAYDRLLRDLKSCYIGDSDAMWKFLLHRHCSNLRKDDKVIACLMGEKNV